jgi:hypothetical protein
MYYIIHPVPDVKQCSHSSPPGPDFPPNQESFKVLLACRKRPLGTGRAPSTVVKRTFTALAVALRMGDGKTLPHQGYSNSRKPQLQLLPGPGVLADE